MASRRESSQTIYPFTPAAQVHSTLLAGIKDAMLLVTGAPTTLPAAGDFTGGVRWSYLRSISTSSTECVYVFYSVENSDASENLGRVHTFSVTPGQGVVRVADGLSWLMVDSNQIPTTPMVVVLDPPAALEPCNTQWRTRRVTALQFFNEYRDHDPKNRGSLPADSLVKAYNIPGSVVKLKDGWNCSLHYSKELETLYITGGAGEGLGRPTEIYWDSDAPNVNDGIFTINGIGSSAGNVNLKVGNSLAMYTGIGRIDIDVR